MCSYSTLKEVQKVYELVAMRFNGLVGGKGEAVKHVLHTKEKEEEYVVLKYAIHMQYNKKFHLGNLKLNKIIYFPIYQVTNVLEKEQALKNVSVDPDLHRRLFAMLTTGG